MFLIGYLLACYISIKIFTFLLYFIYQVIYVIVKFVLKYIFITRLTVMMKEVKNNIEYIFEASSFVAVFLYEQDCLSVMSRLAKIKKNSLRMFCFLNKREGFLAESELLF